MTRTLTLGPGVPPLVSGTKWSPKNGQGEIHEKMFDNILQPYSQSRQSAKLFLQSSKFGLPQPLTRRRVCPPPFGSGGRGTLAGERGGVRVPIPTRGHTLWYSLYMYFVTLLVYSSLGNYSKWSPKNGQGEIHETFFDKSLTTLLVYSSLCMGQSGARRTVKVRFTKHFLIRVLQPY